MTHSRLLSPYQALARVPNQRLLLEWGRHMNNNVHGDGGGTMAEIDNAVPTTPTFTPKENILAPALG